MPEKLSEKELAAHQKTGHPALLEHIDALEAEIAEREASDAVRQRAYDRAKALWQEAHGTMDWPDLGDLCVWLMERLDACAAGEWERDAMPNPLESRLVQLPSGSVAVGWIEDRNRWRWMTAAGEVAVVAHAPIRQPKELE